jgi:hypothetical protein
MRPKDIDHFFTLLAKGISFPATVLLTGGGAAILSGVSRATQDLDFQITLTPTSQARREALQKAIAQVETKTGIMAQYDTSIETWSSIAWPSPRPKFSNYRRFGSIQVRILDPLWWSVGKIARYLSYDVSDVITVFKRMKVQPEEAMHAWGKALGRSPLSNMQSIFKRQAFDFVARHGRVIWGPQIRAEHLQELFLTTARKTRP